MNVAPEGEERPVSWRALEPNTPVIAADGTEIGTVQQVQGWDQEDIFHGLVVRRAPQGDDVAIPADQIGEMTSRQITIRLTPDDVTNLPPYGDATGSAPAQRREGSLDIEESQ